MDRSKAASPFLIEVSFTWASRATLYLRSASIDQDFIRWCQVVMNAIDRVLAVVSCLDGGIMR